VTSSIRETPEKSSTVELDELDRKILQAYLIDARLSYRELAHKLGVSTTTIQSRTSKLEKSGIIRGYSAIFDHEKIGFQLTALTEVSVAKGKLLELEKEVAKMPQVLAVYDVTGITDAMVIAKFKSREELSKFKGAVGDAFRRTNQHPHCANDGQGRFQISVEFPSVIQFSMQFLPDQKSTRLSRPKSNNSISFPVQRRLFQCMYF